MDEAFLLGLNTVIWKPGQLTLSMGLKYTKRAAGLCGERVDVEVVVLFVATLRGHHHARPGPDGLGAVPRLAR